MFRSPPRMPPALPHEPEFHLLEQIAAPFANINASKIALWVYRQGVFIRELVLSGHAEPGTCGMVTSRLLQVITELHPTSADVSLTAGAAHIIIPSDADSHVITRGSERLTVQDALDRLVGELAQMAETIGLLHVFERSWASLRDMRHLFRAQQRTPVIGGPDALPFHHLADFIPIIPDDRRSDEPLIFTLEGWHFDCPEFQAVAERHLRKVQRELMNDAVTRRRIFRGWLREWLMQWIHLLHEMPEEEALEVHLKLPGDEQQQCHPRQFLGQHLALFAGDDRFVSDARYVYDSEPFGQSTWEKLREPYTADQVEEVNFPRGRRFKRPSDDKDRKTTLLEQATEAMPSLLSTCLRNIQQMNELIAPYEDLGKTRLQQVAPAGDAEKDPRYVVDDINRRVLIDTMIRGWPSFYLDDRHDREAFQAWSDRCREGVWRELHRQARRAGVAIDLLLEPNIFYDVRFTSDLNCRLLPLMLFDNKAHMQVHGSAAGASCSIPLWPRRRVTELVEPAEVSHQDRARALVDGAAEELERGEGNVWKAGEQLRLALVLHPPEAGKAILREWVQRLGAPAAEELGRARMLVEAVEAFNRGWHLEAAARASAYLEVCRNGKHEPVPDAWAIAAVAPILDAKEHTTRRREIRDELDALEVKIEEAIDRHAPDDHIASHRRREWALHEELRSRSQNPRAREAARSLIERALADPHGVRRAYIRLGDAALHAPAALRSFLENEFRFRMSDTLRQQCGPFVRTIQALALIEMTIRLAVIDYHVGDDAAEAKKTYGAEVRKILASPWFPLSAETTLREIAKDFRRSQWDRLYTHHVQATIREMKSACLGALEDLLADRNHSGVAPLEESVLDPYLTLSIQRDFAAGLMQLFNTRVPLGRACSGCWSVLNDEVKTPPAGARLVFDAESHSVALEPLDGDTVPLLTLDAADDEELDHLALLVEESPLLEQASAARERSLARGLLATDVVPVPKWQRWNAAMMANADELLLVLSRYPMSVSLFPHLAPPLSEEAVRALERIDAVTPRATPRVESVLTEPAYVRQRRKWRLRTAPAPASL